MVKSIDRSKVIGKIDTIKWLKKRCEKTALEPYLKTEKEYQQFNEIRTVFRNFDKDGSGNYILSICEFRNS